MKRRVMFEILTPKVYRHKEDQINQTLKSQQTLLILTKQNKLQDSSLSKKLQRHI